MIFSANTGPIGLHGRPYNTVDEEGYLESASPSTGWQEEKLDELFSGYNDITAEYL